MLRLSKIHIQGFKKLLDVDIEMRPLMIMIGANGIGKTSILDALSLLSKSAKGMLNVQINAFGGIANLLTAGKTEEMSISVKLQKSAKPYRLMSYELHLNAKGQTYSIPYEMLSSQNKKNISIKHLESTYNKVDFYEAKNVSGYEKRSWDFNQFETSLSQVPKLLLDETDNCRNYLSSLRYFHLIDVGKNAAVKLPQQMHPAAFPGGNGEDLAPFLYYLRETDIERYETIIDTLRVAFHGFESLSFPPVAAGMLSMTWKDKNFRQPMYMHQLSDGALRFLWLISLLQSPELPAITMIDEPEVSLHPELLSLLVDLLREASERTQLVIATHSDRLIRFLEPHEVVVMDETDDGCAQALWADTLDLDKWLEEYSLDEIWQLGRMGGRS